MILVTRIITPNNRPLIGKPVKANGCYRGVLDQRGMIAFKFFEDNLELCINEHPVFRGNPQNLPSQIELEGGSP